MTVEMGNHQTEPGLQADHMANGLLRNSAGGRLSSCHEQSLEGSGLLSDTRLLQSTECYSYPGSGTDIPISRAASFTTQ